MANTVRLATLSDAESMVRVSLAARLDAYSLLLDSKTREKFIKSHTFSQDKAIAFASSLAKYTDQSSKYRAYVSVTTDGRVQGYIKFTIGQAGVYISNLYVNPIDQGQGIGRELFNTVLQTSEEDPVVLDVVQANQVAIKFYASRGFVEVAHLNKTYYSLEMIRMQKG